MRPVHLRQQLLASLALPAADELHRRARAEIVALVDEVEQARDEIVCPWCGVTHPRGATKREAKTLRAEHLLRCDSSPEVHLTSTLRNLREALRSARAHVRETLVAIQRRNDEIERLRARVKEQRLELAKYRDLARALGGPRPSSATSEPGKKIQIDNGSTPGADKPAPVR